MKFKELETYMNMYKEGHIFLLEFLKSNEVSDSMKKKSIDNIEYIKKNESIILGQIKENIDSILEKYSFLSILTVINTIKLKCLNEPEYGEIIGKEVLTGEINLFQVLYLEYIYNEKKCGIEEVYDETIIVDLINKLKIYNSIKFSCDDIANIEMKKK